MKLEHVSLIWISGQVSLLTPSPSYCIHAQMNKKKQKKATEMIKGMEQLQFEEQLRVYSFKKSLECTCERIAI